MWNFWRAHKFYFLSLSNLQYLVTPYWIQQSIDMLADFSSHILLLPPLNFELISDYICCVIRNPNAEPLYPMEAGPVYLTNHSVPEVCLPIYPYEQITADDIIFLTFSLLFFSWDSSVQWHVDLPVEFREKFGTLYEQVTVFQTLFHQYCQFLQ